ncbi:MAG: hypothetical protein ACK459_06775 [Akkermansiaceae bacterium]
MEHFEALGFLSGEHFSFLAAGEGRLIAELISPFLSVVTEGVFRINVFAAGGYGVFFQCVLF